MEIANIIHKINSGEILIKKRYKEKDLQWFGKLSVFGDYILDYITRCLDYEGIDKNNIKNFINSNEFMNFCSPKLYPKAGVLSNYAYQADAAEAYIGTLYLYYGKKAVIEYLIHNIKKYIE